MQDKALSLLGLAKKAGRLAIGGDAAAISVQKAGPHSLRPRKGAGERAYLVITATDASEGTVRRARSGAGAAGIEHIPVPYTKFELGSITGRGSPGVVAILDKGLAESFKEKLAQRNAATAISPPQKAAGKQQKKELSSAITRKEGDA